MPAYHWGMLRGETSISIKTLHQTRKQRAPVSFRVGRHRFLLERNVRCIVCKQDSSASRSAEHVMPESIGSKKRVLAPGVVCDQCNNYFSGPIRSGASFQRKRLCGIRIPMNGSKRVLDAAGS